MSESHSDVVRIYHDLAVRSYCKFLSLLSNDAGESKAGFSIIAALRLLKLVAHRPNGLPIDKFNEKNPFNGISDVPIAHWADVIPQLMSFTGHKDSYARKVAAEAIVRVGTSGSPTLASDIAFRVSHGLTEAALAFASPVKVQVLQGIKDSMQASDEVSNDLFDHISILHTDMERLVSPWDELWAHVIRKVSDKLQSILAVLYQDVSREIKAEIYFNKPGSAALTGLSPSVRRAGSFLIKNKLRVHVQPNLKDLIKLAHKTLETSYVKEIYQLTLTHSIWTELPSELGTVAVTDTERTFQKEYSADLVGLVRWILGADEEVRHKRVAK